MILKERILTFSSLGDFILNEANREQLREWCYRAKNENAWFTEDNVILSLDNIAKYYLNNQLLTDWADQYKLVDHCSLKKIGIVAAGNIPAVGFHDLMAAVISGNIALIKLSSSDTVLMKFLINKLIEINHNIGQFIQISDKLNEADAFIATGSDNSAKYFEYYFSKKPHIIRRNRTSVAILNGSENKIELGNLGNDILQFFGLGCRNVSKIYVPKGYTFDKFFESIDYWSTILLHHKYNNNYDYNKSIYLVNGVKFFDNGFFMLKPDEALVSPISTCFYQEYDNREHLDNLIGQNSEKIQCIVSSKSWYPHSFDFGLAQSPTLIDYADGIDVMNFLTEL
ncbi:MAG: acyl-CoA reductase [Spirosomaceae bacterium]|nr:acyl-CoA reductase [Spirosomataceae bacterium]